MTELTGGTVTAGSASLTPLRSRVGLDADHRAVRQRPARTGAEDCRTRPAPRLRPARHRPAIATGRGRPTVFGGTMTSTPTGSPQLSGDSLQDQIVVVIGGSAGIGLETGRLARARGAEVILTGRNPERLQAAGQDHFRTASPSTTCS